MNSGGAIGKVLIFSAVVEIATGLALIVAPSMVGHLLLGSDLTGIAATVARVAGIALIALGVACWPGTPTVGMLLYNSAVAMYLAGLGFVSGQAGPLLWPAVLLHAIVTGLLLAGLRRQARGRKQTPGSTLRS